MRIFILYAVTLLSTLSTFANDEFADYIQVPINNETLRCFSNNGIIEVVLTELEHLVEGKYPDFKLRTAYVNANCLLTEYLKDKALKNGGIIQGDIKIQKLIEERPIYKCPSKPKPCPFCDLPECEIVSHEKFFVETIRLNLMGLIFTKKSEWKI